MKKKTPASARQLPVDFGNESLRPVPIRKLASAFRNGCHEATLANGMRSFGINRQPSIRNGEDDLIQNSTFRIQHSRLPCMGFTLVEILVVLVLLSLIIFALMAVFSGTQRAFRASLTQTDTLEGGRAVMDLITSDLQTMTPNGWQTNISNPAVNNDAPINFYVWERDFISSVSPPSPLFQPFLTSPSGAQRTNILEDVFILSKGNINGVNSWVGTGYSVTTNLADGTLYPLYRFYMVTNASSGPAGQSGLFGQFFNFQYTNSTLWSHLMDGVVNLTMRAYDTNGTWITNGYVNPQALHVRSVRFQPNSLGLQETDCVFYSNAVPASVEVQLATLEDHTLLHAESLGGVNQSNYLSNSAGQVHVFRQHVWIRNLDPTAYQ